MINWSYSFEDELEVVAKESRAEGKAEGKTEGKTETAIQMLRRGFSAEVVSEITSMPIEWVQGIRLEP